MSETKILTVADADKALNEARFNYDRVHAVYETARRDETAALNALNEAQKKFDAAVDAVRKNPPWNSDWHNKTIQRGVGNLT